MPIVDSRYYVAACVIFPIVFYVPKWFELKYVKDVPRVCYRLKHVSECLSEASESNEPDHLQQINNSIVKLLSIFCWNRQASITEQVLYINIVIVVECDVSV